MIEMKVMGIALDTRTGSPIVVLHDKNNRKALPIWIGSAEASAIIRKIENLSVARPMTHDLIISILLIKLRLMTLKRTHIMQLYSFLIMKEKLWKLIHVLLMLLLLQ